MPYITKHFYEFNATGFKIPCKSCELLLPETLKGLNGILHVYLKDKEQIGEWIIY